MLYPRLSNYEQQFGGMPTIVLEPMELQGYKIYDLGPLKIERPEFSRPKDQMTSRAKTCERYNFGCGP